MTSARTVGWSHEWRDTKSGFQRYEVFTSPEGVEYRRTPTRELADLVIDMKSVGLAPLFLKRLDKSVPKKGALTP